MSRASPQPSPAAPELSDGDFHLLVDSLQDHAIIMLDPDGRIASWNTGAERIEGLRAEEVVGKHFSVLFAPEELASDKPALELRVAATEGRFEEESWRVRPDGTRFWAKVVITALRDRNGELRGFARVASDLTKYKRDEEALNDRDRQFRSLFDNMSEGVALHEVAYDEQHRAINYRVVSVNPAYYQHTGIGRAEIQGCLATELYRTEEPPHLETYARVASSGQPCSFDTFFPPLAKHFHISVSSPKPGYFITMFEDITERKRAEAEKVATLEALRASEARFSTVFRASPESIAITRLSDNKLIDVNYAWENTTGYTRDEAIGRSPLDLASWVDPNDRERLIRMLHEHKTVRGLEFQLRKKSGEVSDLLFSAELIELGGQPCMVSMALDITKRKRAEVALARLTRQMESILNSAGDGIYGSDREGYVTFANPAMAQMVGWEAADLLGQSMHDVCHHTRPDGRPYSRDECPIRAALQAGNPYHADDEVYWRKDGTSFPAELTCSPIREGDQVVGTVVVAKDITQRKQMEAALRDKVAVLRTLAEIDREITAATERQMILDLVCRRAAELVHAPKAAIATRASSQGFELTASFGLHDPARARLEFARQLKTGVIRPAESVAQRTMGMNDDQVAAPHMSEFRAREDIRSIATARLSAGPDLLALLMVFDIGPREWSADELEVLDLLASQAALAFEKTHLYEMARSRAAQLETLNTIGQAINSTLDAETILDRLVDEAMRATYASHGCVCVARPNLDRFAPHSLRGYTPEQVERARQFSFPLDQGLNGCAYRTQQAVSQADVQTDPDYLLFLLETRSELVVPIIRSGQVLGNLNLESPTVDAFRDVDTVFLHALTDQVAIALENARLFEDARRHLDEMAVLSQVALIGAAGRPFEEAVAFSAEGMPSLWSDSRVSILLVDEASRVLRPLVSSGGVSSELAPDCQIPLDQGISGWVARERQPVRVGDVTLDSRYVTGMPGMRSEMAAPLMAGERAIGVINVECPWPNAYSNDDLDVLAALASELAIILERCRLDAELAAYTASLERRVEERTAEINRQQVRTLAILDALGEGVIVTDPQGHIEYLNAAAQVLTGYEAREVMESKPSLWRSDQTPLALYQQMWDTILQGKTWRGEIVNRRRDGTLYDADLTVAPIFNDAVVDGVADKIVGFAGIQRDISLRKRVEEQIRLALAQEKELSELKSRFVWTTSHEFRTPLMTILSSTDLLEHYADRLSEEKQLVHLRRIRSAVQNMTRLLDDVLVGGQADAGRLEFNPVTLNLTQFCRDMIEEIRLNMGPKHTFRFVSDGACVMVPVDQKLLRQILGNLLSNAVKYSPDGGVVELTLTCQNNWAILHLRDEGIGIPEKDRARLFEMFHRAENVGKIPGTGLGLAIAKKSVDMHGGTIDVDSRVGRGTTVTVMLPMRNGE